MDANTDSAPTGTGLDSAQLPTVPYDREAIYTALERFDENEPEFQAGLQTILGPMQQSGVPADKIEETRQRAKVFFWSQSAGVQVDYADYKAWKESQTAPDAAAGSVAEGTAKEPYPASFDAIAELIATGKTDQIPGIREIPLQINEQPPSQAVLDRPLKPWERAGSTDQIPTLSSSSQSQAAPSDPPISAQDSSDHPQPDATQ